MHFGLICCLLFYVMQVQVQAQEQENEVISTVLVNGKQTDIEVGRDFVAGKVIIGRQRIAESGLQNVGELLTREPAISVGKDGRIGLLGLSGYTQVLVDGMPPQRDSFSMDLIDVEKIEIVKSSTAVTGPIGIAGTINIVRRKVDRKTSSQARISGIKRSDKFSQDLAWSTNQIDSNSPLSYNLRLSALRTITSNNNSYLQNISPQQDDSLLEYSGAQLNSNLNKVITATGEVNWKINTAHKFSFSPEIGYFATQRDIYEERRWSNRANLLSDQTSDEPMRVYGIPVKWDWKIDSDSSFSAKLNLNSSSQDIDTLRSENWANNITNNRKHLENRKTKNQFINVDYINAIEGGHDVTAGIKLVRNQSNTRYSDFFNGEIDYSFSLLGPESIADVDSAQLFIQDEWRINRNWSTNAGISFERRLYQIYDGIRNSKNNYNMFAPSVHISRKIGADRKKQVRLSLARSFQPPSIFDMSSRPIINPFAGCQNNKKCGANTVDTPDNAGNPDLKPESAVGINLSYSHGIGKSSEVLVEFYSRDIRDKTAWEFVLADVIWATEPRYIYRPANLGKAKIRGINFEGRFSGKDISKKFSSVELYGSINVARSELSDVPGPDNAIIGQSPWSAKLGGSYVAAVVPLRIGFDINFLPEDWVRHNVSQKVYEAKSLTVGTNASWTINKSSKLYFNIDNLFPQKKKRIDIYNQSGIFINRNTRLSDHTRVTIRYEKDL